MRFAFPSSVQNWPVRLKRLWSCEQVEQSEHVLDLGPIPARPGQAEALFDQMFARPFDGAGADRPSQAPVARIVHAVLTGAEVLD